MTTDTLIYVVKSVDLGFFPKKRENDAFFSTGTSIANTQCKKHEGVAPSRSRKKVTKVTQAKISKRLKGKVKFSWSLLSNVRFPGATLMHFVLLL